MFRETNVQPRRIACTGILLLCAGLVSCGPDAPGAGTPIRFRMHALECAPVDSLEARLEIGGVDEPCILNVSDDRTVSGTCRIPAGGKRAFRLLYLARVKDREVELASITAVFDLSAPAPGGVELDFTNGNLESGVDDGFDVDGDEISNLDEFCAGTL